MKVLVFAKQIPDVNQIKFDPESRRIVRENVPLLINSFDKKAVEEAVRIKENLGWETSVATMGPPQAADILNDSLRMGIDQAYLITDRSFAGSDTLVTSLILAKLVERLRPDLVLMGKYSLDGETSQVPPEVAVLAGYNFKSSVSKIEIDENSKSCKVEHESESGLTSFNVKFPAVLSVSEKINRARAVKEDVPDMKDRIVTVDGKWLGTDVNGSKDSPTVVTTTENIESSRNVEFIENNEEVYEKVLNIIEREASEDDKLQEYSLDDYSGNRGEIWGIAYDDARTSLEISTRISELASDNNLNVTMVGNIDPGELTGMGCHRYIHIKSKDSEVFAKELVNLVKQKKPEHIVYPSTVAGREVSAMVAASMKLGLTADCIDVRINDGKLVQYKPAFGGGIVASILSNTSPSMATVRPGIFRLGKCRTGHKVEEVLPGNSPSNELISFESVPTEFRPLGSSGTVVGVGRGLKSKSNLPGVMELAEKIGASVGGTRPIVDMRWMPRQQQIGLTGISISPKTYLSLGVSGQDNHVVGIRYAGKVIAVNTDREAPIFRYADFGIVGDANEFVTKFNEWLDKKAQ